jgi:hypothetical protein
MLVFFIHGVATQDVKYARSLESLIREEFKKRRKSCPHFYSSFWANILKDVGKMWNWIEQDLQEFQEENSNLTFTTSFVIKNLEKTFSLNSLEMLSLTLTQSVAQKSEDSLPINWKIL